MRTERSERRRIGETSSVRDMCVDICLDMCIDMRIDLRVDMCTERFAQRSQCHEVCL